MKIEESFSKKDIEQLEKHGLSEDQVRQQIRTFRNGIPFVNIFKPATLGDGIISLDENDKEYFISVYEQADVSPMKFVPASGAATRMFRFLHQFLKSYNPDQETLASFLEKPDSAEIKEFFQYLDRFPFYHLTKSQLAKLQTDYGKLNEDEKKYNFVKFLLEEMNYSSLPKGLIPFHQYDEQNTMSAYEEHLNESLAYALKNGKAELHFTIKESHLNLFESALKKAQNRLGNNGKDFKVSYSYQGKSTNTIAVNPDNKPYRDEQGQLFFRPGGHGALIQNLNRIDNDVIFIKNIDNVVPENKLPLVSSYKKALAGILISIQQEIFGLLEDLDKNGFSKASTKKAFEIANKYFHHPKEFKNEADIRDYFDRPVRVCGMVVNEGAPGGGPFWVRNDDGKSSLQIVEQAEIDSDNPEVQNILSEMTHFNPVDLVCGVKNYQGEKFDLQEFVAPNQGFIANKSINGKAIKALELPGLWNGAMAYWNTIFVEVPHETFNPVKTALDLLKPGHQVDSVISSKKV